MESTSLVWNLQELFSGLFSCLWFDFGIKDTLNTVAISKRLSIQCLGRDLRDEHSTSEQLFIRRGLGTVYLHLNAIETFPLGLSF